MSIRTLESTRVAFTLFQVAGGPLLSPGQPHDLLRRHLDITAAGALEALDYLLASRAAALQFAYFHLPSLRDKLHLGPRKQSELIADLLRDRDLPFARDLHEVILAGVLLV